MNASIFWRRLDVPGSEAACLVTNEGSYELTGTAIFVEAVGICRLDYDIQCDSHWRTRGLRVSGVAGNRRLALDVRVDAERRWFLDGVEQPLVAGCDDIDLGFSPSTNLLPIRRLDLRVGQSAEVKAAWLAFPATTLEPLDQVYRRSASDLYRYESDGGRFSVDLEVNPTGFVTDYPGLWRAEVSG